MKYEGVPVVRLVDTILYNAITLSASDIHIEPTERELSIRFRVDGTLIDQPALEGSLCQQVLARIKILANLDSAQRRVPQDGKFRVAINNHDIDMRVSTFPAVYGEHVVIRILDKKKQSLEINQLGMSQNVYDLFVKLMQKAHGFFLVCGPTGSGKTTTLYAALTQLNKPDRHIITLEDPVEYNVKGITQGQISPAAGFTFAQGMRSILRQDPDIVMIGEIRDTETAHIAIQAALTGHLVLSTVHTNDAPSAIIRLMDMGIEPFLINAALSGVLAQRLVRTICKTCKTKTETSDKQQALLELYNSDFCTLYKGAGCNACSERGYLGRTGVFELLEPSRELRSLIVSRPSFGSIYEQTREDGMQTLQEDGVVKVQDGIITIEELARVTV